MARTKTTRRSDSRQTIRLRPEDQARVRALKRSMACGVPIDTITDNAVIWQALLDAAVSRGLEQKSSATVDPIDGAP